MTPSMQVTRNVVMEKYAADVDKIYASRKPD